MKKISLFLMGCLLLTGCSEDKSPKTESVDDKELILSAMTIYAFEVGDEGSSLSLPIIPGEVSIETLEKVYTSVEEYADHKFIQKRHELRFCRSSLGSFRSLGKEDTIQ